MSLRTVLSMGVTVAEVVMTALLLIAGLLVLVCAELLGWIFRP